MPVIAKTSPREEDLLTTAQLSSRWRGVVKAQTLENWRSAKRGPTYIKVGRSVLYRLSDVLDYERSHTIQRGKNAKINGAVYPTVPKRRGRGK